MDGDMTRAAILSLVVLSLAAVSGCQKKSTTPPDEDTASGPAEEEDFSPDEEEVESEEEEAAPGLSARASCRAC